LLLSAEIASRLANAEIARHTDATIDERRNIDSEVFWSDAL